MAGGKPEYSGGTVIEVLDRDADSGVPSSHIERDHHGNRWHVAKGKTPVLLRDESDVEALRG